VKIIKLFIFILLIIIVSLSGFLWGTYTYFSQNLPSVSALKNYRPKTVTTFYADDGTVIAEIFTEKRKVVPINKIPRRLVEAFVAAEDANFFTHKGIDYKGILRALYKNLEAGEIIQGGSTITQQVAKSLLLSPTRSWVRKIKEAILAYRIEKNLTKEEILYLYLNQIFLGHGAYGVAAAAENYFGKDITEINLAEAAILAGLPRAPSRYSPYKHPKRAKKRQEYVLKRMVKNGYITKEEMEQALNTKIIIKGVKNPFFEVAPYFAEYVRQKLEQKYGREVVYNEGLKVYTTVLPSYQKAARKAILKGLKELDKRQGYRGPIMHLEKDQIPNFLNKVTKEIGDEPLKIGEEYPAVVTKVKGKRLYIQIGKIKGVMYLKDLSWARKPNPEIPYYAGKLKRLSDAFKEGDVIKVTVKKEEIKKGKKTKEVYRYYLEQDPIAEASLLSFETKTGYVRAMVGGKDFMKSPFNRAIQAIRQPGSSFKPIIYAAAIDKNFTPATIIYDSPVVFRNVLKKGNRDWKPHNYGNTFYGPVRLRVALEKSINVATIKILQDIGVDYVIKYAKKLGITSNLEPNLSLALGSSGLTLFELTRAYSVFANHGFLIEPIFIKKVVDRDGKVLEENIPPVLTDDPNEPRKAKRVISKETAYIITSLLEGVIKHGTGWRVKKLGRPAAGKTGTTNNLFDAWFIGFTPDLVTGVWVGFDEERSLGEHETGSRAASPIWLAFMQEVLQDKPIKEFVPPKGIVFAKIDSKTGKLANKDSNDTIFECFKEGTVPSSPEEEENVPSEDFFKTEI